MFLKFILSPNIVCQIQQKVFQNFSQHASLHSWNYSAWILRSSVVTTQLMSSTFGKLVPLIELERTEKIILSLVWWFGGCFSTAMLIKGIGYTDVAAIRSAWNYDGERWEIALDSSGIILKGDSRNLDLKIYCDFSSVSFLTHLVLFHVAETRKTRTLICDSTRILTSMPRSFSLCIVLSMMQR